MKPYSLIVISFLVLVSLIIVPASAYADWVANPHYINSSGVSGAWSSLTKTMNLTNSGLVHGGAHIDMGMFNQYSTGVYLPQTGCLGQMYCDNLDGSGYCTAMASAAKSSYSGMPLNTITDRVWNGAVYNTTPGKFLVVKSYTDTGCTTGAVWIFGISVSNASAVTAPVSSFTCAPLSQDQSNGVVCTDTSSNTPTDWLWTIDMEAIEYDGWQTSTSRNFTWYSSYPGYYGVNLKTSNSAGEDWENRSSYVQIYNSSLLPANAITLTANPNLANPGDHISFTTTCGNTTACTGPNGMHLVTYSEKYPDPSWDTHTIAIYHYNVTSGGWDYRPSSSSAWQVGSYNPLTGATADPTISGEYTYYVNLVKDDYNSIGQADTTVTITGSVSGSLNMLLSAQDQTTGGHLSNYQMNLTNDNTLVTTEWGIIAYDKLINLPRGQDYTVQCSKTGYIDGETSFTVPTSPDIEDGDMGTFVNCPLYPTGSVSSGNTTVTVKVFDFDNSMPLPNVQVQMSAPIIYTDSPKYTGGDGSGVYFVLGQNQDYYITASKTGYCAVTETGSTGTDATQNKYVWLKYGTCLGPTPTHTPIPSLTPTPSIIVTPTQFQPGNATSFWDPWIDVFTMMGANTGEINMLLAGLIIILCMAAGAGMAGVLGAEVAMGFGAIFCVAIGLIPIWVVLAIIILGFLFYGLKIGR